MTLTRNLPRGTEVIYNDHTQKSWIQTVFVPINTCYWYANLLRVCSEIKITAVRCPKRRLYPFFFSFESKATHERQTKDLTRPCHSSRQLVAGVSQRRTGFASGSVLVGFIVAKVAMWKVYLSVLRVSPVNIISPRLSIPIYHMRDEQ
jgi:hypothetical protein